MDARTKADLKWVKIFEQAFSQVAMEVPYSGPESFWGYEAEDTFCGISLTVTLADARNYGHLINRGGQFYRPWYL